VPPAPVVLCQPLLLEVSMNVELTLLEVEAAACALCIEYNEDIPYLAGFLLQRIVNAFKFGAGANDG
jgi:hypothetical protein